jgi:hypothetical protein
MLSSLITRLLPLITLIGEEVESQIPEIKIRIQEIVRKHRKQMASDPNYPTMLIFLASLLIRRYVKKQSQAATLIILIEQTIRQALSRIDWNEPEPWEEEREI